MFDHVKQDMISQGTYGQKKAEMEHLERVLRQPKPEVDESTEADEKAEFKRASRGPTSFVTPEQRQVWANRMQRAKKAGWDKEGTKAWNDYTAAVVGKFLFLFRNKADYRMHGDMPTLAMLKYMRSEMIQTGRYDHQTKAGIEHMAFLIGQELEPLEDEDLSLGAEDRVES